MPYANTLPIRLPNQLLTDFVLGSAGFKRNPSKLAIVEGITQSRRTFAQLESHVRAVAINAHHHFNIRPGDVVTLMSPNHIDTFAAVHGVVSLGGVVTPVNPLYTAPEVASQLKNSQSRVIIAHPTCLKACEEAAKDLKGQIRHIIALDGDEDQGLIPRSSLTRFSELLHATAPPLPPPPTRPSDLCLLPYSSGTTGLPKGTMLSHANIVANLLQCHEPEGRFFNDATVVLSPLPLFHIYGFTCSLHLPLLYGSTLVTMTRFHLDTFLSLAEQYKATRAQVVPPIVLGLAKSPAVDHHDLSSLRLLLSGAAPLGAALVNQVRARLPHLKIKQAWGMSELSPIGTMCADDDAASEGSVGRPVAATAVKICDLESGHELPPGEHGELLIRGPQVMRGYLNNQEVTAKTVDSEGWLHTGDVASMDHRGFVFLHERVKELIKFKGFQVAPAELEALLVTHPALADAIVIPRLDDEAGETPRAYVVRRKGAPEVTAEEVAKWVEAKVAPHKRLRGGVVFVEQLPKTASGKLLRREVLKVDRMANA